MPWPDAQLKMTVPVVGASNVKTYGPASVPCTPLAGNPLTRRSVASTPVTGSLNTISVSASCRTSTPSGGCRDFTVGAVVSTIW